MSTTSRIVSGSLASWVRIGITFFTQLILVPVYLSYWSPGLYGLWLSVLAFVAIWSTLDFGHAEYLGFEFLKLGRNNRDEISRRLWSGIGLALILSVLELILIGLIIYVDLAGFFMGELSTENTALLRDSGLVVFALYFAWIIKGYMGGILQRALYPFGHYPRLSWWGVGYALTVSLAPVAVVVAGGELLAAGVALALADILFNLLYYYELFRLISKENIGYRKAQPHIGFQDYKNSLVLSGKSFLEKLRHQGIRVILAPLSGAAGVAAFSTMRTGANVALQGLGTITGPMLPELMRFLNQKDQKRTETAFGTVWLVVVLFAPAVVVLQVFIEPLYVTWTRGSISFNPLLFALLSLGVLVYGLAQPAIAVAKGNNLLKPQLTISILAAVTVVGGMFLLVPILGILGAAVALFAAEIVALICYRLVTKRWLAGQNLAWPAATFGIAATSVMIAGLAMAAIVWLPVFQWITLAVTLPLLGWNIKWCWNSLPDIASEQAKYLLSRVPVVNYFI